MDLALPIGVFHSLPLPFLPSNSPLLFYSRVCMKKGCSYPSLQLEKSSRSINSSHTTPQQTSNDLPTPIDQDALSIQRGQGKGLRDRSQKPHVAAPFAGQFAYADFASMCILLLLFVSASGFCFHGLDWETGKGAPPMGFFCFFVARVLCVVCMDQQENNKRPCTLYADSQPYSFPSAFVSVSLIYPSWRTDRSENSKNNV